MSIYYVLYITHLKIKLQVGHMCISRIVYWVLLALTFTCNFNLIYFVCFTHTCDCVLFGLTTSFLHFKEIVCQ